FPEWERTMNSWGYKLMAAIEAVAEMAAIGFGLSKNAFMGLLKNLSLFISSVIPGYVGFLKLGRLKGVQSHQVVSPLFGRRHIDLKYHKSDLPLEVHKERYSRSKLLFQNLQILFKVDFDQGFEGLRLSSFARVLGFIKVLEVIKFERFSFVSGKKSDYLEHKDEKHVWFEVKLQGAQGNCKTEDFQEQEKVHLGIKVGADITVIGLPGQEGPEGNVAGRKKMRSKEAKLRNLLKYKAWLTRRSPV
ncbi:hypothetical protein Tco_0945128, partial [Tanacetum coccineum]